MKEDEIIQFLNKVTEGQMIRVSTKSGRVFDGVLNGEHTGAEAGLYFDSLEGQELRAEWANVEKIEFRNARSFAGKMMVPPEHPLSGQHPARMRADGVPLKPHTSRNR